MKILIDECLPVALKANLTVLGQRVPNGAASWLWLQEERRTLNACRGSVECAAHQRPKHQAPTEYDGEKCFYLDPLREIESHEGLVATHARLR